MMEIERLARRIREMYLNIELSVENPPGILSKKHAAKGSKSQRRFSKFSLLSSKYKLIIDGPNISSDWEAHAGPCS
jgi:hypothetical protein